MTEAELIEIEHAYELLWDSGTSASLSLGANTWIAKLQPK
jgi:hypothetical protein